jgi:phosphoglycolate phosphatase-like HAD superfamily hydrolase
LRATRRGSQAAASKAGVETVCAITDGWSKQELREAVAVAVFESVDDLRKRLGETPLSA